MAQLQSVDASVSNGRSGLAALARNHRGEVLDIMLDWGHLDSVLEAEFKAILLAIRSILERGWGQAVIKSDCKLAIDALNTREHPPDWLVNGVFTDIVSLTSAFSFLSFDFAPRSCNLAADALCN